MLSLLIDIAPLIDSFTQALLLARDARVEDVLNYLPSCGLHSLPTNQCIDQIDDMLSLRNFSSSDLLPQAFHLVIFLICLILDHDIWRSLCFVVRERGQL